MRCDVSEPDRTAVWHPKSGIALFPLRHRRYGETRPPKGVHASHHRHHLAVPRMSCYPMQETRTDRNVYEACSLHTPPLRQFLPQCMLCDGALDGR